VGHVRNAQAGVALHGAVDDVDRIAAQHQIDEWSGRALPALELVLAHAVHQAALLAFAQLNERPSERLAGAVERAQRNAIKIRVRWAHVEDASLEQRLLCRDRYLLINEMRYARLARARDQRLAERIERRGLRGCQRPERNALRARCARREQDLGTADHEGESAHCGALDEGAPFHLVHDLLPRARIRRPIVGSNGRTVRAAKRRLLLFYVARNSTPVLEFNQAATLS
jgi:hypothetical protein